MHPLRYKLAMANYIADFGNEENIPRSSRSASYTASVASDEAFLLMEYIKKCAVHGRA